MSLSGSKSFVVLVLHFASHHWPRVVKLSLGTNDLVQRCWPHLVRFFWDDIERVVFEVAITHLWHHRAVGDRMSRPDSIILCRRLYGRIKTIHFLNCGLAWLLLCHQFSLLYYKLTFRIILRPILILIGCLFLIFLSLVFGFFIESLKSTMF